MKLSSALATFVTLLLAAFLGSAYALVTTSDLLDQEATDLAESGESARLAEELKSSLLLLNRDTILHSIDKNYDANETSFSEKQSILTLLNRSIERSNSSEEEVILSNVKIEINNYLVSVENAPSEITSLVENFIDISRSVDAAILAIEKLVVINKEQMASLKVRIDRENTKAYIAAIVVISVGSAILLCLTLGIVFMVVMPLSTLSKVVNDYGLGATTNRAKLFGIAEIRAISSNFNSMADRLDERDKDRLRFIASIAHDLRNPIGSMAMASELLLNNLQSEDKELASIILRQIKSLDRLVGDLLDTTRIESGQLRFEYREVDLGSILIDAVELHRTSSKAHRLTLIVSDEKLSVKCDAGRILQVINNLLSNAIKYSPSGGEVRLEVVKDHNNLLLSVSDQGIGIANNDLSGIFKPFQRSSATIGTIPGIGLGLSVSRHIVEAHGGTLTVKSHLGAGSTFLVQLPIIFAPV